MLAGLGVADPADERALARLGFGALYVVLGALGVLLNLTTVAMIVSRRVYRLSAYTIMANVALADALMMSVIGIACGNALLFHRPPTSSSSALSSLPMPFRDDEAGVTAFFDASLLSPLPPPALPLRCMPNVSVAPTRRPKRSYWQMSQTFAKDRQKLGQKSGSITQRPPSRGFGQNISIESDRTFRSLEKRSVDQFDVVVFERNPSTSPPLLNGVDAEGETGGDATTAALLVSFAEIAAWTVGVMSYAFLGLNRCVAICYYGTSARCLNRVWVAVVSSVFTWIVGITAAFIGTFPRPYVQSQPQLWTLSFLVRDESRSLIFFALSLSVYAVSVALQWVCSTLVLVKIHQVKRKISRNKLNESSAIRFKKQARLTFQFFYPSLFCTISSILYFVKPFCRHLLADSHLIALHIVWLLNHLCNPFIYAYFNDRMRVSYRDFLTCAHIRQTLARRRRRRNLFKRRNLSRRSAHHQMSTRSAGAASCKSDGNFVRNSLQMQSRDFEQLCEFMMRVNPLGDSSEGWRESSTESDSSDSTPLNDLAVASVGVASTSFRNGRIAGGTFDTRSAAAEDAAGASVPSKFRRHRQARQNCSSRSIVLDLGRQTVEHWAVFAKKASI